MTAEIIPKCHPTRRGDHHCYAKWQRAKPNFLLEIRLLDATKFHISLLPLRKYFQSNENFKLSICNNNFMYISYFMRISRQIVEYIQQSTYFEPVFGVKWTTSQYNLAVSTEWNVKPVLLHENKPGGTTRAKYMLR